MNIEIFGQLFQAITIMLVKEKSTEDIITDLSKIVFKEESRRVSKKMINHARSWLYLSNVIGYCSKSINCDHLNIVDNCRYNGKRSFVRECYISGIFELTGKYR